MHEDVDKWHSKTSNKDILAASDMGAKNVNELNEEERKQVSLGF